VTPLDLINVRVGTWNALADSIHDRLVRSGSKQNETFFVQRFDAFGSDEKTAEGCLMILKWLLVKKE
jgi:hypothetical protein